MIRCMSCMNEYEQNLNACPICGFVRGTPAKEAFHLSPESILSGKYIVGKVLGFGGFGVTYIGYDAQLQRTVAIKEFFPTSFATRMPGQTNITAFEGKGKQQFDFGIERFIDEARRLAKFNGIKGITDIYDTFIENGTAYIVMEYLKGKDVKQLLSESGLLDYEKARNIIINVCDTLAPVHAQGIIHRDISPDNIYILDTGEIKLLDFGAARYESSANSKSLSVILKSGYAPEEQYRARGEQGSWTDVYALAATFYKMLTGITPPDSMERAINDEIKEPSKLGANIPQSAENTIMNALNIKKDYRTQTVSEFKTQLLSDGVVRTKVKNANKSANKMPIGGKITIAIAVIAVIALVALQLTGVFNTVSPQSETQATGTQGEAQTQSTNTAQSTSASSASTMVEVPNVEGMQEEEAVKALEDAGFVVEYLQSEWSLNEKKGEVIFQNVPSGEEFAAGKTISIKVSEGSYEDALGMPILEALPLFDQMSTHFFYAFVYYEFNEDVPEGIISEITSEMGEHSEMLLVKVSAGSMANFDEDVQQMYSPVIIYKRDREEATLYYGSNGHDWNDGALSINGGEEIAIQLGGSHYSEYRDNSYFEQLGEDYEIMQFSNLDIMSNIYTTLLEVDNLPQTGDVTFRIGNNVLAQQITYEIVPSDGMNISATAYTRDDIAQMVENGELHENILDNDFDNMQLVQISATDNDFQYALTSENSFGYSVHFAAELKDYYDHVEFSEIDKYYIYGYAIEFDGNTNLHLKVIEPIPLASVL